MPALADALVENTQMKLAVATPVEGQSYHKTPLGNIEYYVLPMPSGKINRWRLPLSLVSEYQRAVEDFQPDVIHIHGTEIIEGLITGRGFIQCPTVISVQGIIDVYQKYYWGNISLIELLKYRTLRDWVCMDGVIEQKIKWIKRAKWEREVFASHPAFLGRTLWDRAHTRRLSVNARYHHCGEILRQPFYDAQWDIKKVHRHTVFTSSAAYPLKGFHVLVKAIALLKNEFPDICIRTPLAKFYPEMSGIRRFWKNMRSTGYERYLTELIRFEKLEGNIVTLPSLNAKEMANELQNAHVYVLPSLIENSPNSLGESMLVGTPSVASFVGGIQSMTQDEESALLFPAGDEAVLAEQIRRIFNNDDLACGLSVQASNAARIRHDKIIIVNDLCRIYSSEITQQDCVNGI